MNMYKFGNYICKLRETKGLTQSELADILNVSDKSISKWENGQAFPRIDTFEKLAAALDTTIEDVFSASKDGIKRICILNNFCSIMRIEINSKPFLIEIDEGKWIELKDDEDELIVRITGDIISDSFYAELEEDAENLKDKIMSKLIKKNHDGIFRLSTAG